MAKKTLNLVKLGLFATAGIGFLILVLYVIGKNQNLFGKTFILKARFENVHGLMRGNNIRFGGIDAGTVGNVQVLNDTTIEVTLLVKTGMRNYIHNNANVTITTDGLMGNKLINIVPVKSPAPLVTEGDILFGSKATDPDHMLEVLNKTNEDVAITAGQLKETIQRINESKVVWKILNDQSLPLNIRASLARIKSTSENLDGMTGDLSSIIKDVKNGKGTVGALLTDTTLITNLNDAINKIKTIGESADTVTARINAFVSSVDDKISNENGTVNALLGNKEMRDYLSGSLRNIEEGTRSFNENMEALRHSFLFRGYFKKLERQKKQGPANSY